MIAVLEGTFRVQTTARSPLVVSADGGVISHAGSRLLADLADRTTLTSELAEALAQLGRPRAVHDPGRVLVDLAVAVADGAECISDIAVLGDQRELFGSVASDSTVWRLLDQLEESELAAIAAARAAAREVAWAQRRGHRSRGAGGNRRRSRPTRSGDRRGRQPRIELRLGELLWYRRKAWKRD